MRRFSRSPSLVWNAAKLPRPASIIIPRHRWTSLSSSPSRSLSSLRTTSAPSSRIPARLAPLNQAPKRYCSYRRMCRSRHAGAPSGSTTVPGREVLPTNVKPLHYDLTLEPDFEKFTYEGTVIIEYVVAVFLESYACVVVPRQPTADNDRLQ